jgi:broad-specificity NMP kinase
MPIIVAGTFGTGKSTWLNVLHFLMDKKMVNHDTFKTGDNMVAATEGIWVYPKPLFWENNTQ